MGASKDILSTVTNAVQCKKKKSSAEETEKQQEDADRAMKELLEEEEERDKAAAGAAAAAAVSQKKKHTKQAKAKERRRKAADGQGASVTGEGMCLIYNCSVPNLLLTKDARPLDGEEEQRDTERRMANPESEHKVCT